MSDSAKGKCRECKSKPSVSREGWCLPCLRKKLSERFGHVNHMPHVRRPSECAQDNSREENPWSQNAVRHMEDGQ